MKTHVIHLLFIDFYLKISRWLGSEIGVVLKALSLAVRRCVVIIHQV